MWGSMGFQDGSSLIMEQLILFHDHTMMIMVGVMSLVGYVMWGMVMSNFYSGEVRKGQGLEVVWTVVPGIFLLVVAFPSLRLLYVMEEGGGYELTMKVLGYQWFWKYEVEGEGSEKYMRSEGIFRLLETEGGVKMPFKTLIRLLISSGDVIHSWTVPSLGVSVDATPGRLSQVIMNFSRSGVFTGQCSEICGVNHSFMPIAIKSVSRVDFVK